MAKAASRSRLAALHAAFTDALIDELKQSREEEIPLPAADKSVIAKFLKDNNISADADDEAMGELADEFEDELAQRREARKQELLGRLQEEDDDLAGIIN
ncbi:terminase small subunit [Vibrio phage vB_VpaP_C2]|uniref:Putative DNA maturase A n=1 Tax=Vibrio phage OWB TaxID=2713205 RepID=A0A6G6XYY6_9CAUD|nr:terminase small subunit [Vibrio phage vB_VpaS_OWB]QIG66544.1 putative DNA maturase A [Vibrio phage OWB]USL89784.1 terminase small subunit [Vibrio phage vB_VpaP_M83]USL89843.1 terminase small subunit [Vibrio phage vB_VpaP_M9]USL89893.1 terminase small subunit [Vibrio phage vB_VpaP_C2]USL89956.1 terminase small subunit [Vibrio phage vB_VpaP_M3]